MKRFALASALLLPALVLGVALFGKDPAPALGLKVEKPVYALYETVEGEVANLEAGETCTVELVDAYGRVVASTEIKRRGFKGTPWRLQIRAFSTMAMTVHAKGAKGGESRAAFAVRPPTEGWTGVLLVTPEVDTPAWALGMRTLGIRTCLGPPDQARAAAQVNLRSLVTMSPLVVLGAPAPSMPMMMPPPGPDAVPAPDAPPAPEPPKKPEIFRPKREPCLSQAELPIKALETFRPVFKSLADFGPVAYAQYPAPAVVAGNAASDTCFDNRTLSDFRVWLKDRAASPAVLARDWNVTAKRWEDVVPMTTEEILKREFGKPRRSKTFNFAPWADHRAFMDEKLAATVKAVMDRSRVEFRDQILGFGGGEAPAAFGGFDWSRLVGLVDVMECTDPVGKRLVSSLNRQRYDPKYTLGTVGMSPDAPALSRALWASLAAGDLGVVLPPGVRLVDATGATTDLGHKARPTLEAFEGVGITAFDKDFVPAPTGVFLYYSPASIRVQYLLDAGARGDAWRPGERSDDLFTSTWHRNLLAWTELLDDLGIEFEFLSASRTGERGWTRGVKVLILPKVVAMSKDEAARLRQFVEQGGTLIADSQCAIFDEHGVQLAKGELDTLFGLNRDGIRSAEVAAVYQPVVDRPMRAHAEQGRFKGLMDGVAVANLRPVEPKVTPNNSGYGLKTGNIHACLTRPTGGGTAYLNLSLIDYPWERKEPAKVAGLREIVRRLLALADVRRTVTPAAAVDKPIPDVTVRNDRYRNSDFLFVLRHGPAPVAPVAPPPVAPPEEPMEPQPPDMEPGPEQPVPPPEPAPAEPAPAEPAPDQPAPPAPEPPAPAPGELVPIPVPPDAPGPHGPPPMNQLAEEPAPADQPKGPEAPLDNPIVPEQPAPAEKPAEEAPTEHPAEGEKPAEAKPEEKTPPVIKGDFLVLKLDRERFVYDPVAGRLLGKTAEPLVFLPEGESTALVLLDYEAKGVDVMVTLRPQELTYTLRLRTDAGVAVSCLHAFRVEFIDPKGKSVPYYRTVLAAPQGAANGVFNLALNDASGEWTLRVTEVLTGAKGETKFNIR